VCHAITSILMHTRRYSLSGRLIVFCRYPVPGRTKTRLIPHLGPVGAADLHRYLTEIIYSRARKFARENYVDLEIRFEGSSIQRMKRWLGTSAKISKQGSGNLGIRMNNSFSNAFRNGFKRVVLIGTDIPHLTEEVLENAFNALDDKDVVLGPSTDGGYWLIGLKRPVDLFRDVEWGKDTVLKQTLDLVKEHGLNASLLEPLSDIDDCQDLLDWSPDMNWKAPYLSVIIPALNEEKNIANTVRKVINRDVEVIVVDGGSRDNTRMLAADAGAIIMEGQKGRPFQQNIGARAGQGRVFLFLHADTIMPKDYQNIIFDILMDPQVSAGGFSFKTDSDYSIMRIIEYVVNIRSKYLGLPYGDQGLFMKKSTFECMGGFPEVPIAEDILLVNRLAKRGKISVASAAAVTSARRWQKLGILRTTLINCLILAGFYIGIPPEKLAFLYGRPRRTAPPQRSRG
jgi:rSAM/selenodomain-associated transferase 2/rSAM/selenodomain-associated transferase 1